MQTASHDPDAGLPAIGETRIGDALVRTSDARELHDLLKVGRDFNTWIRGRIAQYGFVEGVDFVTVETAPPIRGAGNRGARVDYFLTLGMAKEVAMVENNAEGRRIRRYYIECERRALEAASRPAPDLADPRALRALLLAYAEREIALEARATKAEGTLAIAAPKAAALDRIAGTDGLLAPSDAAKTLGLNPRVLMDWLREHGWCFRRESSGRPVGYQDKIDAGLLRHKAVPIADGRTVTQVYVTPKGLARLARELGVAVPAGGDLFAPAAQDAGAPERRRVEAIRAGASLAPPSAVAEG